MKAWFWKGVTGVILTNALFATVRIRFRVPAFGIVAVIMIAHLILISRDAAAVEPSELASAGSQLARIYCYECHGSKFNGSPDFDVTKPEKLRSLDYVIVGDADGSAMWQRIASGEMPPEDFPRQPSTADKAVFRRWIEAGAPQPIVNNVREHRSRDAVLTDVERDLHLLPAVDRTYQRYFDLTHLWNNPSITAHDLQLHRAAISKLVNSLTWEVGIVLPTAVDDFNTILRVDLRRLGWSFSQWNAAIGKYPYGIKPHGSASQSVRECADRLSEYLKTDIGIVRGDWFVATASRPPLYDLFLKLPDHAERLQTTLGVDFVRNFNERRVQRAGFSTSGVSRGNRLVERHPTLYGYLWKSYDFRDGGNRVNLFRFPLGPKFEAHPFPNLAFEHDGGELIFSLPNGLQGYMLVDEQDRKIDVGPIEVVRDIKETSGSPEVVNGLSCMHCHSRGMIRFTDRVREGHGLSGQPQQVVNELHPSSERMSAVVLADIERFQAALNQAVLPFFPREASDAAGASLPHDPWSEEPIGSVARRYHRDLDFQSAMYELDILDADRLRAALNANETLPRLGLLPLRDGGSVKRAEWENSSGFTSTFQETARVLQLGTPVIFSDQ